jgi:hypothetical protein
VLAVLLRDYRWAPVRDSELTSALSFLFAASTIISHGVCIRDSRASSNHSVGIRIVRNTGLGGRFRGMFAHPTFWKKCKKKMRSACGHLFERDYWRIAMVFI